MCFLCTTLACLALQLLNQPVFADTLLLEIHAADRERVIPIKVYLPKTKRPVPIILFSHGLGGSRDNNAYLGRYWAENGYLGVFIQHPGSDSDIWKNSKPRERLAALKSAANLENSRARIQDVRSVIDQLEIWNQTNEHALSGRLDIEHIGMSGHSFGAVTTLRVAGLKPPFGQATPDERISAFMVMSPQPGGNNPQVALRSVKKPMLCMTGTDDRSVINRRLTPEMRQQVYESLPAGDKYQLVLQDANHMSFSDSTSSRLRKQTRNPQHHAAIQAISVKFWDAYLNHKPEAKKWLQSTDPFKDGQLAPADSWKWK